MVLDDYAMWLRHFLRLYYSAKKVNKTELSVSNYVFDKTLI